MSGLIDMWTSEANKLRNNNNNNNQVRGSDGSSPSEPQSSNSIGSQALLKRANSPRSVFATYSEASVSMLVDYFSP
ncbi:hypothetical protein CTI12_AA117750 [Artemisia annua]|uniref:Uncharacterized protein n=1 Tax=Artemisia annua TaxID=35608 RepID=A0A2U1PSE8_ARTAN|nr:hypothetical protein CTI12_AA117750 [Artemisia annua]